jgi:hypothetical protein
MIAMVIGFSSCDSPTDVPANRTITTVTTTDLSSLESAMDNGGDYGNYGVSESPTLEYKVKNTSKEKAVIIQNIYLARGNQGFSLVNTKSPDTLDVASSSRNTATFSVKFTPSTLGVFEDEIVVKSATEKRYKVKVTVLQNSDIVDIENLNDLSKFKISAVQALVENADMVFPVDSSRIGISSIFGSAKDVQVTITNMDSARRLRIKDITFVNSGWATELVLRDLPAMPLILNKGGQSGSSATFTIRFNPTTPRTYANNLIRFGTTNRYTTLVTAYDNTALIEDEPQFLVVSPNSLVFAPTKLGETSSATVKIRNTSTTRSLLIGSTMKIGSHQDDFTVDGVTTNMILYPNNGSGAYERTITVRFSPKAVGNRIAKLVFGSNEAICPTLQLNGSVAGTDSGWVTITEHPELLRISPDTLDFGDVPIGTTVTRTITFSNTSTTKGLGINALGYIGNHISKFSISAPNFPLILDPNTGGTGHSRSISVSYTPTMAGEHVMGIVFGYTQTPNARIAIIGKGK